MAAAEVAPIAAQAPTGKAIFRAIIAVMRDAEAIGKDRRNEQQRYSFRGIDDVYNELHTHLAKHGVFTVPRVMEERSEERATKSGGASIYRILRISFTFYAEDGSSIEAITIGEGMDSGDKASNKAMAVAHKYALLQVFAIPTEDPKDPEVDSHQVAPKQQPAQQPQAAGKPQAGKQQSGGKAVYDGSQPLQRSLRTKFESFGCTDQSLMVACDKAIRGVPLEDVGLAIEDWIAEFAPAYSPGGK